MVAYGGDVIRWKYCMSSAAGWGAAKSCAASPLRLRASERRVGVASRRCRCDVDCCDATCDVSVSGERVQDREDQDAGHQDEFRPDVTLVRDERREWRETVASSKLQSLFKVESGCSLT